MRIDVWDVKAAKAAATIDCGYPRNLEELYTWERVIGKGGFGLVRVVKEIATGVELACKSVSKTLDIPNLAPDKQAQHIDNIEREIKILKKLRGTLSVVHFKGAYEDDEHIHIVMEYCKGGELHHTVGRRIYTEEMVAGYMRSVLHTLAQCHSHHILHRDIKPGNFMLLTEKEDSPLKAIDFGLAVFYKDSELPRTDLGLEGTPWFMAPEVLSSTTYPESDLWSAGVMAYQLLSGYLPFDDPRNPDSPALSIIWKSILTEEPSFRRTAWKEVSVEAKDFVKVLLNKDHTKRPSAKEMLQHRWLQQSFHVTKKRPLSGTVVQRIQRFAQSNVVQRTILEFIAMELLKMMPPHLSPVLNGSMRGGAYAAAAAAGAMSMPGQDNQSGLSSAAEPGMFGSPSSAKNQQDTSSHGSDRASDVFPMSPEQPASPFLGRTGTVPIGIPGAGSKRPSFDGSNHGGSFKRIGSLTRSPSIKQMATLAAAAQRRGAATVHGPSEYWRIMRAASELAAMESGHGQMNYLHTAARTEEERMEQRKAARLSLDTSVHGGSRFDQLLKQLEDGSHHHRHKVSAGMRAVQSTGALRAMATSAPGRTGGISLAVESENKAAAARPSNLERTSPFLVPSSKTDTVPMDVEESRGHGRSAAFLALAQAGAVPASDAENLMAPPVAATTTAAAGTTGTGSVDKKVEKVGAVKTVSFRKDIQPSGAAASTGAEAQERQRQQQQRPLFPTASTSGAAVEDGSQDGPGGPITTPQDLEALMRKMQFKQNQAMSTDAMANALKMLGYDLQPTEVAILLEQLDLDADKAVQPSAFVASQLDWAALQQNNRDLWLECAGRAFADLDKDSNGKLTAAELINSLREKLPAAQVDFAVEDALLETGCVDAEELDFEGFLRMLNVGSHNSLDSLDQYDPRLRLAAAAEQADFSLHGARSRLQSVPEEMKQTPGF